jgi:hypothetical protein
MKYLSIALVTLCSLTYVSGAEARNAGIRADLPCPFGPGSGAWTANSTPSPYNAGLAGTVLVTLQGNIAGILASDEFGQDITSAVQYDSYAAPPTAPVGGCTASTVSTGPLAQVLDYGMANSTFALSVFTGGVDTGTTLNLGGLREVEFNYDQARLSAGTTGTASFTIGGVTFTSNGGLIPFATDNDFLFDSTGKLLGALATNGSGTVVVMTGTPTGWTASSGGGTTTVPEIDPASAAAALTLLVGGLAILRSRRRTSRVVR